MIRPTLALSLVAILGACTPATVVPAATSTVVIATASPTQAPTPTPSTAAPLATSTATVWADACGRVSDFTHTTTTTNGSFVLNSPGRTPLKITLTPARTNPEATFGNYVCVALDAGLPYPIFAGLGAPNTAPYIPEGTYPATNAMPAPTGFVLPQSCAYVAPPQVGERNDWKVDCGAEANRNARGTLGAALQQQGWSSCSPAAGTMRFMKGTLEIVVVESSLAPGDYPRFTQGVRSATGC